MTKQEYAPMEIIAGKLLTALDDESKVAFGDGQECVEDEP